MLRNLHHANLLLGAPEEGESYLRQLCSDLGIKLPNNPDFFVFRAETFGIDEARDLRALSARKAVVTNKIFLIMPLRITPEAQNALLKTFEDPYPDTYFFLVLREEELVLPTLRSRMQTTKVSGTYTVNTDVEEFVKSSLKERLLFAERFADKKKNLPVFLDSLLLLLRKEKAKEGLVKKIYNIRRLVSDSGVASRLIIEHLALVL